MGKLILTGKSTVFVLINIFALSLYSYNQTHIKISMIKSAFLFTESGKTIKMDLVIFSQAKMNSGLGMIIFMPCSMTVRFVYKLITLLFCVTIIQLKSSLL